MQQLPLLVGFAVQVVLCGCLTADAPLEPAGDRTTCSLNGAYCAFMRYGAKKTEVWKVARNAQHRKQELTWEMDGWFQNVALSNDGQDLIVASDGGNLLDPGYKPDQVILTFYHRGKKMCDVRLNELVHDPSALEKTESHYRWCESYGLDVSGKYVVNTVDGHRLLFDASSGRKL